MELSHSDIRKAIIRSQHCQRNWDLSKSIPKEDLDLFSFAVSNCPSKQNFSFYRVHFITERETIEQIHSATEGFVMPEEVLTNSQTLANLLMVFEEVDTTEKFKIKNAKTDEGSDRIAKRDRDVAIGIAAGYINLTASMLGYSTGCCQCFDQETVQKILNLEKTPLLLMGIGFKNPKMNRRIHHLGGQTFPTKIKEAIDVTFIA